MSGEWHGGKGSAPRKQQDKKAYDDGWERIFGKKHSGSSEGDSNGGRTDKDVEGTNTSSDVPKT